MLRIYTDLSAYSNGKERLGMSKIQVIKSRNDLQIFLFAFSSCLFFLFLLLENIWQRRSDISGIVVFSQETFPADRVYIEHWRNKMVK